MTLQGVHETFEQDSCSALATVDKARNGVQDTNGVGSGCYDGAQNTFDPFRQGAQSTIDPLGQGADSVIKVGAGTRYATVMLEVSAIIYSEGRERYCAPWQEDWQEQTYMQQIGV